MYPRSCRTLSCMLLALSLGACQSLLPKSKQTSDLPWASYQIGQQEFSAIIPGKTTLSDLHSRGINPADTPNIAVLNHADINRRLHPEAAADTVVPAGGR